MDMVSNSSDNTTFNNQVNEYNVYSYHLEAWVFAYQAINLVEPTHLFQDNDSQYPERFKNLIQWCPRIYVLTKQNVTRAIISDVDLTVLDTRTNADIKTNT